MDGALTELAAYFRRWREPPDAELVRLAAAARAAGSRWDAIAAACDERDDPEPVIADDCPRCGWHGYFHHYIATVDGDWAAAVCDDCYADLHPGITVTVRFYAARVPRFAPRAGDPIAVIRQRDRSDHDYPGTGHFPDIGQQLTWQLSWKHTPMLVDDRRGNCEWDLAEISRAEAEQITAGLAARHWPPDAAPEACSISSNYFFDLETSSRLALSWANGC